MRELFGCFVQLYTFLNLTELRSSLSPILIVLGVLLCNSALAPDELKGDRYKEYSPAAIGANIENNKTLC